jgi:fumarylacetoacetase
MAVSTGFGLENLPYGVFRQRGRKAVGVRFGDGILDLGRAVDSVAAELKEACRAPRLNELMSLGPPRWRELRAVVRDLVQREPLIPLDSVEMLLPAEIGDYTDFYASIHHATNVGRLFRPDQPLLPNYKWVPVGYHGRASSVVVSSTPINRPTGQQKAEGDVPRFGPSRMLDYEVEAGFFVGQGNPLGEPIPVTAAEERIFGMCLVNDWSARDIQAWEYQPLGPFLGKSFATTISPWVVTMEALEPYRVPVEARAENDPAPLPYLSGGPGTIDVRTEAWLSSAAMRECGIAPVRLSRSGLRDLYWTPAQMLAHHTSNGCNLRAGDLLATGTVSGPSREELGCLLEITRRGSEPVMLPTGESRGFLEHGDEVTIRGYCGTEGSPEISLGECVGRVVG